MAVELVGVTGVLGNLEEVGEPEDEYDVLRRRGRNDGGSRLLDLAASVLGLSRAARSGSTSGSMLVSSPKLLSGPSASMTTLSAADQSTADGAAASEARIASKTSRVNCVGDRFSMELSRSQSDEGVELG